MTPIEHLRRIMQKISESEISDSEDSTSRSEISESDISDDESSTDPSSRSESDEESNSHVSETSDYNIPALTNEDESESPSPQYAMCIRSLTGWFLVKSRINLEEERLVGFVLRNCHLVEGMLESENPKIVLSLRDDSKSLVSPENIYKTYAILVIELLKEEDREAEEDLYNLGYPRPAVRTLWKRTDE